MKEIAEQSAGIIVYRINSENIPEFLLLNGDAIGWGFPKGHVDKGENLIQTAKRETYEETSLKISKLKPAFVQNGTITAANASKLNDFQNDLIVLQSGGP